jgi:hypothetical protein
MKQAFLEWVVVSDVMVSVATAGIMPQDAWDRMIIELKTRPIKKILATSLGTTDVDSLKRKVGTEVVKSKGIQVVIVTDDRLVRGLVTAASWLGANITSFSWSEMKQAVQYLQVPGHLEEQIHDAALKLRKAAEMGHQKQK